LDVALFTPRVATVVLGVLGGMGAMLALTGIFGMAAYSVSRRLRELGIRIALGAKRKAVLQTALGRPLKLLAVGSAVVLLLEFGCQAAVVPLRPSPRVIACQARSSHVLAGLLATWIPRTRALVVNPLTPFSKIESPPFAISIQFRLHQKTIRTLTLNRRV
jgi:hypothetical protein